MSKEKLHIGYICSSMSWGGLEMNQLKNAQMMKKRGHQVFLLIVDGSPIYNTAKKEGLTILKINHHHKYYHFSSARQLTKVLKEHKIQNVIIRDNRDIGISASAKRWFYPELKLFYFMEMQLTTSKKSLFHRRRFEKIDQWSCPLPYLKDQVIKNTTYPKENIVVIPSGIDLEKYDSLPYQKEARKKFKLPEKAFIYGVIGRIDPQKGQSIVLDAFNEIHNKISNAELFLMGDPTAGESTNFKSLLVEKVQQYNIKGKVHFHPFSEDTLHFYAACDVVIMASYAETFGMVTLEALAAGKPVIGSNNAGTPDILEQGKWGKLFKSKNPNSLQECMMSVHEKTPSTPTHESLKKYDFENVCDQVEQLIWKSKFN